MTSEKDIERYLVRRVHEAGGLTRKLQWIGHTGAPDRVVFLRGYPPIFVELKAPGKKLSPHQVRELNRMMDCGACVCVIDSYVGVETLIS